MNGALGKLILRAAGCWSVCAVPVVAMANDTAPVLSELLLAHWKDAALILFCAAAAVFWYQARRLLLQQRQMQEAVRQEQEKRQDKHFLDFADKLKTLDARFQHEIDGFAAVAGKRAAGNEKLLRAQEHALKNAMGSLRQQAEDIGQTMDALRTALNSKDEEIRRLKEGHDAVVWAKFVRRFIRVHQYVDDLLAEGAAGAYLQKVKMRLDGALEECGVEPFAPPVGSRYDEQPEGALDGSPEEMPCPNDNDEFKIIDIVQRGYRLSDSGKIIAPAKVRIYAAARPRQRENTEAVVGGRG